MNLQPKTLTRTFDSTHLKKLLFPMLYKFHHLSVIGMGLFLASLALASEGPYRIPLKPDPPFSIDGDLADWQEVPNEFILADVQHVIHEPKAWKGADDLSAKGKMAWREGVLYLSIEVTDDTIVVARGRDLWKGDHIELFFDLSPLSDPGRSYFGPGQWQFGLSPGNFKTTGNPGVDIKPEAICFQPEGVGGETAIRVAARRTPAGYALEAAIPFSLMNWEAAREGAALNAEIAISDCDSAEPKQEKMMTLSTETWVIERKRLIPMVLANATGAGTRLTVPTGDKPSAPTGPIPTIEPETRIHKPNYTLKQPNPTTIEISIQGERFAVESQFSSPDGKWNRGSSSFYEHRRRIEPRDEAVVVFDTFKNTSQEDIPVMQFHSCAAGGETQEVWLRGLKGSAGSYHEPANPTTYVQTEKAGIGLLALNDEFRVHAVNSYLKKRAELADKTFVLKAKETYTAEWAMVPVAAPDPSSRDGGIRTSFWSFVNATRRLMDANFTLPYQFAFIDLRPGRTDEYISSFVRNRGAHFVSPIMLSEMDRSTSFLEKGNHAAYAKDFEQLRRVVPGLIVAPYFDCFLDPTEANMERFQSDRTLNSEGIQGDYGGKYSYVKEFLPTLSNGIGREFNKVVDKMFALGASGIYQDEFEGSNTEYHYGDPWDGVSGDIHPTTFKLLRKKSSVRLVSQDYRVHLARRIMAKGPLIANGMPATRTVAALKIQRFNETGVIINCARTLLYSPIALGDHLTERSELDAYKWMLAALDFGCVYNWYTVDVMATHPTLASYMFPITPMELHEGYIIGKERIVTKKSGRYGWGDASLHEVHVFNEKGKEVPDFKALLIAKDGKTFTELRIAEGWSAAIIRK